MATRARSGSAEYLVAMLLAASAGASGATDRPAVIPIKLIGNFPVLTASIGGNGVPLVFDSGNSTSVALTQAVLDRLKAVPIGETSKGMDPKGNTLVYPKFKIPRIEIGDVVFTEVVAELDVHDASYQATPVGQQGFLGTALLKRYQVVLDYPHLRMTLIPAGSKRQQAAGCSGAAVPFSPAWHGEPAADAEIDLGRLTMWWDTGAATSILSKRFVDAAPSHRSGDSVLSKRLILGTSDFGPFRFLIQEMSLPPGFDGFVGYTFFAHHVVCLDFPGKRLLIHRSPG